MAEEDRRVFKSHKHFVKSVQRRIFFWSVFSHIRAEYEHLRIQCEYGKIRTRKNSIFGHKCLVTKLYQGYKMGEKTSVTVSRDT